MTQPDPGELLEVAVTAHVRIPRDVLVTALLEALERRPELLAAALEKMQQPDPHLTIASPRWPADTAAFGSLLRERRTEASLTREQLSMRSGVAPSTIRNIECNRHHPTSTTRRRLMRVFDPPPA